MGFHELRQDFSPPIHFKAVLKLLANSLAASAGFSLPPIVHTQSTIFQSDIISKMANITINNKFTEILASFGDVQESVNLAVQRYTIEQITTKINELRQKDEAYQKKYGVEYTQFATRTSEDEDFINQIETNISKTWEIDLTEWEFAHKGVEDWSNKLQDILLK